MIHKLRGDIPEPDRRCQSTVHILGAGSDLHVFFPIWDSQMVRCLSHCSSRLCRHECLKSSLRRCSLKLSAVRRLSVSSARCTDHFFFRTAVTRRSSVQPELGQRETQLMYFVVVHQRRIWSLTRMKIFDYLYVYL